MRYVGLDLSLSGTGVAVLETSANGQRIVNAECTTVRSRKAGVERLLEIEAAVSPLTVDAALVAIEGYAFGAQASREALGELGGVVKRRLYRQGVPFVVVAPGRLKKFACGKGTAGKGHVMLSVYRKWGVEPGDDNQADAYALARIAWGLATGQCDTEYEREVLQKLKASREG